MKAGHGFILRGIWELWLNAVSSQKALSFGNGSLECNLLIGEMNRCVANAAARIATELHQNLQYFANVPARGN